MVNQPADDQPAPATGRPREAAATAAETAALTASLRTLQRENSSLRLLIAIHDRLGALVLEGATPHSIATVLSRLVNKPVILLDSLLKPVTSTSDQDKQARADRGLWNPNQAFVARVLQTLAGEPRAIRLPPLPAWGVKLGCVLAPVVINDAAAGYLALLEPETETGDTATAELDLQAAQHAASVYALALMRQRITSAVSTELKDELMEGLLLGQVTNEVAARERARQLGYDESLTYRALTLVADETLLGQKAPAEAPAWTAGRRARHLDHIAEVVRDRAPDALVAARREELAIFLPQPDQAAAAELGRDILSQVAALYPDWPVTIGVGGPCLSPSEMHRSYAEARRAAEIALRFGRRGQVVAFQDLGIYRLLFQVSDRAEMKAFVDQVLGALIEYDRRHHSDLVHTVACYLANDNSLQATARELFVHVNTAAYRIQRIQAITGRDLAKTDDCLLLRVALMILEDIDVK